jgi:predicted dehydrogenase
MSSKSSSELSRRDFLKASGATVALAGAGLSVIGAQGEARADTTAPSEKVTLGFIGISGRGNALMNDFMALPDVQVAAVSDVYEPRLQAAKEKAGGGAKTYADFRKLLEQKDIDAVVVATPPHWHPLVSILACQAGKDVYCEKPISLYPAEARAMLKAAIDNKRMTQAGTQIHAGDNYRRAVEIVRSGMLGKISTVRVVCNMNEYPGIERVEDSGPPAGLDWDTWLGPAPKIPFNKARFDTHHNFKDYVGSWLHELGPHIVDLAYWAMDPGEPKAVSTAGGRYVMDDMTDVPDTMDVLWEYDGFNMTWMHTWCNGYNFGFGGAPDGGRRLSVIFHGTNGTLAADYGSLQVITDGARLQDFKAPAPSIPSSPGHQREFVDSIKSRKQAQCCFEYHVPLAVALNLAHISLYTGRKLHWDAKAGKCTGDPDAEQMCTPNYRKPWALPA